jgi:cytochrome c-type biogenesis protein CcmF
VKLALVSLMLVRSPFALIPGGAPPDGQGLNPLLQNPWMAIHPPATFLGFAAATIPFAYAMVALWKNDYSVWARRVTLWAALAFASLGAGICLGGYWAYMVLGWGGFWGWDPVENSSLVPWITSAIALHVLLVVRTKGMWHPTALLSCIFTFLFVMYSTFLTRSGVLGDFSVHSFTDLGINGYLMGWISFFAILSLGSWAYRLKSIPRGRPEPTGETGDAVSLEAAMYWGMLALSLLAALVIIGTSAPLITSALVTLGTKVPFLASALPKAASNVTSVYYAQVSAPVAIMLGLLIAVVPVLAWRRTAMRQIVRRSRIPVAVGMASGIVAVLLGVTHPAMLMVVTFGTMALVANAAVLIRSPRRVHRLGGYVTHVGVGFLLVGSVTSTVYGTSNKVMLPLNQPVKVGDYTVTYRGMKEPAKGHKTALDLLFVDRKGRKLEAAPPVFINSRNQYMTEPYVRKYPLHDLYVSPSGQPQSDAQAEQMILAQGKSEEVAGYTIQFEKFVAGAMSGDEIQVGVQLSVSRDGLTEQITPMLKVDQSNRQSVMAAATKDGMIQANILGISVDDRSVMLSIGGNAVSPNSTEAAAVEIGTKPLINFVWLGTILMILGGLFTVHRRSRELSLWESQAEMAMPDQKPEPVGKL